MESLYSGGLSLLCLDTETDLSHQKMWCVFAAEGDNEPTRWQPKSLQQAVDESDYVVGHNLIGFDRGVLEREGVHIPEEKCLDTLVLSRLYDPAITGGHSLKAWGARLKFEKKDFIGEDFENGYTPEMGKYCAQDVRVLQKLIKFLLEALDRSKFSEDSIWLEHAVSHICQRQEQRGFNFDEEAATDLWVELSRKMRHLSEHLQERYPPIVTERRSEKTGKRLKDHVEEFNLGSRQQVAKRLILDGVKLKHKTEGGQWKIDETILSGINHPSAQTVADYMMLQKRVGMLDNWISSVGLDGRLHGSVNTNGAISGRMTHSKPNLAQIPSLRKPYGEECRRLFIPSNGNVICGMDASGLELRILAHYMMDEDYIDQILSGDIHSYNQEAAGLQTRDQAKTFIYALIYGAGNGMLGEIIGGTAKDGKALRESFLDRIPAYAKLLEKITRIAQQGSVPGLDGRRLRIRHEHAALNQLLQGGGAIVMKKALVIHSGMLKTRNIPEMYVANVHDEWQMDTPIATCHRMGRLAVKAIEKAGQYYELRCPLTGEYSVGKNWAETH